MRPLSGRILVPVVLSVVVLALVVTGLVVRANPGITVVPGTPLNPAAVSSTSGTSGTWTFTVTYRDVNPDPGGDTPTVAQYMVSNLTDLTTVVGWTDLPAGSGTAAAGCSTR